MLGRVSRVLLILQLMFSFCCWAQELGNAPQPAVANAKKGPVVAHLRPVESISTSEAATAFATPFACDSDGNLYLKSEITGVTAIRKLNSKGERTAIFEPAANSDLQVTVTAYFSVTRDGEVYALVYPTKEIDRYVMVFKADGSYKTKIKLQPGFPWFPSSMAVFPNGTLLVTGQEYDLKRDQPMLPFTGIFAADGKLLKELQLEDDNAIHDMAKTGDSRVTSPRAPSSNRAVSWGQIEAAKDGNLYLMRWLSPAVFYAISPGGEVVRRFTVDPGNANFHPLDMHISGNRMAVLFYEPQSNEKIMKIVDLEGKEIATYDELVANGKPQLGMLGLAFACYTQQPERFTFLVTDEHKIQLKHAEPH
jgi:hypothetical protein